VKFLPRLKGNQQYPRKKTVKYDYGGIGKDADVARSEMFIKARLL